MRCFDMLTCRPEWRTGILFLTPVGERARAEAHSLARSWARYPSLTCWMPFLNLNLTTHPCRVMCA